MPDSTELSIGSFLVKEASITTPPSTISDWQVEKSSLVSRPRSKLGYFLRFDLQNTSDSEIVAYLETRTPWVDRISLLQDDKVLAQAGDRVDPKLWPIAHRTPTFKISVPANSKYQVILHYDTAGAQSFPIKVFNAEEFGTENAIENIFYGLYYGILLALALYHLVISFLTREKLFLHYSGYLASFLGIYLILNGFIFQLGLPNIEYWANEGLLSITALAIGICLLFIRSFMNTDVHLPKIDSFLKYMAALSFGVALLALLVPYTISFSIINFLLITQILVAAALCIICVRLRIKYAKLFALGWGLLLIGTMYQTLSRMALVPLSDISYHSVQIGTLAEVLVFTFAMGKRWQHLAQIQFESQKKIARFETELNIARNIHARNLPQSKPPVELLTLQEYYNPYNGLGGDLYDYYCNENADGIGILIADVAGHGISAALDSSIVKAAFMNCRELADSPSAVLASMNAFLRLHMPHRFVTAIYCYYHKTRQSIIIGNAGHPPVLVHRKKDKDLMVIPTDDVMLGVADGLPYDQIEVKVAPDDLVFMFTDGLFEAYREDNSAPIQVFNELVSVVQRNCRMLPNDRRLLSSIVEHMEGLRAGLIGDDITMLMAKVEN